MVVIIDTLFDRFLSFLESGEHLVQPKIGLQYSIYSLSGLATFDWRIFEQI